jgi:hypothetical protein
MTHAGMDCNRCDKRMVPSPMVHEPQRRFMLVTQRTLVGWGRPSRYALDSWRAWVSKWPSPARGPALAVLASRRVTRPTMSAISRCSSALLVRAGIRMTILSPSR